MQKTTFLLLFFFGIRLYASAGAIPADPVSGVFGVCDCDHSGLKTLNLTLRKDATFYYLDRTDPDRPLELSGAWVKKGRRITLVSSNDQQSFHRKWKVTRNGACIRSRQGLNFRRICLVKPE